MINRSQAVIPQMFQRMLTNFSSLLSYVPGGFNLLRTEWTTNAQDLHDIFKLKKKQPVNQNFPIKIRLVVKGKTDILLASELSVEII
jgi:hypothetical protein